MSKDRVLASSAVSKNWQTHIVGPVRAILGLKKGDRILWILRDGEILVRKDKKT